MTSQEIQETPHQWEGKSKTILLIEDDVNNAESLQLVILSETPYHVFHIESGREALLRLDEIVSIKPSLFLLDYHLPAMTALQLYDQLHAIKELAHIPTIIISALPLKEIEDQVKGRQIMVLSKPFDIDELLQAMNQLLASSLPV